MDVETETWVDFSDDYWFKMSIQTETQSNTIKKYLSVQEFEYEYIINKWMCENIVWKNHLTFDLKLK